MEVIHSVVHKQKLEQYVIVYSNLECGVPSLSFGVLVVEFHYLKRRPSAEETLVESETTGSLIV